MDPATSFAYAGYLAMAGWAGLIVSLFIRAARPLVWPAAQLAIPAILAIAYALLLIIGIEESAGGGFGSIEQVRNLFESDAALAAGWLHYLAFDLFVGTWIVRDGLDRRVHPLLILLCLPPTFLFGPTGLLLYAVLRAVAGRTPEPAGTVA